MIIASLAVEEQGWVAQAIFCDGHVQEGKSLML
jgi:prepilin-type processing-associated H-X9-DG protein